MLFSNLKINNNEPIYIQIKNHIVDMISKGLIPDKSKLPSTRELSSLIKVSRNSVILAYEELKSEGYIYSIPGKGTFANSKKDTSKSNWYIDWNIIENNYSKTANSMDIIKNEISCTPDIISFKSISPDGELFNMDELKKSFLNRISLEGHKLLNYGYAQGYRPLIDYLFEYMNKKGVDTSNKDILITNGFTDGLDILLSSFTSPGDYVLCENPTHNTTIKIMKALNLNLIPVTIDKNGLDFNMLKKQLIQYKGKIKFAYITPSYHNPTGTVMSPESRYK
ncbi:aminotransferase-like domain-containing protein, partial [Romboutsia sp. 13368]|uniref:aminotransferase-like domain-containing protein n=1 Tax=Romboutsia sp. 13368 TaxID=2708053 RepID=UPI0025D0FECC